MASPSSHSLIDENNSHAANTPLHPSHSAVLSPPNNRFSAYNPMSESPRESYAAVPTSENNSALGLTDKLAPASGAYEHDIHSPYNEKFGAYQSESKRRRYTWLVGIAILLVIAAAVAIPVGVVVGKHKSSTNDNTGGNNNGGGGGGGGTGSSGGGHASPSSNIVTGGNGSTVTANDGSTFTYVNNFGGIWYYDAFDPFNDNAYPNSWTPPLNTSWDYSNNKIFGVNLGGWFVMEPFITPQYYQQYTGAVDEWTLSTLMAADTANGGLSQLENHYATFITETDFALIAAAGLNWVRVPVPFWAIDVFAGEPFLAKTSWKYILQCFAWARKYGLRVNLDLHTIPGSQNGYNHSGKEGQINFMEGIMGFANAQRALDYIRIYAEFISQDQYKNVVPMFGVINEPLVNDIGKDQISHFYLQAYNIVRNIGGTGAGNGPMISIHDGFLGTETWAGFFGGADRLVLDTHPYICFNSQPNTEPVTEWAAAACNSFGPGMSASQTGFGVTVAGEFSNGYNDCSLFLNGVEDTHNYPGDCSQWELAANWDAATKQGIMNYALASMDALQNWFFWTWKIGNSSTTGVEMSPLWSYSDGLVGGWVPTDPRKASGTCSSLGIDIGVFSGTYAPSQTGAVPSATIDAVTVASFSAWPPASLNNLEGDIALVPTYTPTGAVQTLPPPSLTAPSGSKATVTVSPGNGWFDAQDTAGGMTTVGGCSYPNAWDSAAQVMPTAVCTGPAAKMARAFATPAPAKA